MAGSSGTLLELPPGGLRSLLPPHEHLWPGLYIVNDGKLYYVRGNYLRVGPRHLQYLSEYEDDADSSADFHGNEPRKRYHKHLTAAQKESLEGFFAYNKVMSEPYAMLISSTLGLAVEQVKRWWSRRSK